MREKIDAILAAVLAEAALPKATEGDVGNDDLRHHVVDVGAAGLGVLDDEFGFVDVFGHDIDGEGAVGDLGDGLAGVG